MWGRRRIQGLMAAAVYDELSAAERQEFERRLAASPALRQEYEELRGLIGRLPASPIQLEYDLLPGIRARLAAGSTDENWIFRIPAWQMMTVCTVCLVGAVLVFGAFSMQDPSFESWTAQSVQNNPDTPVSSALREAAALRAQRDFGTAYQVLQTAVAANPEDPYAGQAQQDLAALHFEQFRRYRDAHNAYNTLRTQYPNVFMASPQNIQRLDLLEEARKVEYASLESLDWARSRRDNGLEAFEEVIGRYPASQVASLAIQDMTRRVLDASHANGEALDRLEAMERLREQCQDPIVVGRLDIEIGRTYWREMDDAEMARGVGSKALECGHPAVVEMAQGFLSQLDAGSTP